MALSNPPPKTCPKGRTDDDKIAQPHRKADASSQTADGTGGDNHPSPIILVSEKRSEGGGADEVVGRGELVGNREATRGNPLHLLSSLEEPQVDWSSDPATAQASLSAAVSLVLRLLERDPDAATSRDHVVLSLMAQRRQHSGPPCELSAIIHDLLEPPLEVVGALPLDSYAAPKQRADLAAALNTLLA